jgi:uncharacterized membrane protein
VTTRSNSDGGRSSWNTALTFVLACVLLVALGGVVYVSLTPAESSQPYTEFYVLGENETASDYPTNLTVGETGSMTVGISNHETRSTRYTVLVLLSENETARLTVTLDDGETWEREISVTPSRPGRQELRLLLFEGDAGPPSDATQSLRIWINVTESAPESLGTVSGPDRSALGVG